jgi:hypothetical protein
VVVAVVVVVVAEEVYYSVDGDGGDGLCLLMEAIQFTSAIVFN